MSKTFQHHSVRELRESRDRYAKALAIGPHNSLGHEGNPIEPGNARLAIQLINLELQERKATTVA